MGDTPRGLDSEKAKTMSIRKLKRATKRRMRDPTMRHGFLGGGERSRLTWHLRFRAYMDREWQRVGPARATARILSAVFHPHRFHP